MFNRLHGNYVFKLHMIQIYSIFWIIYIILHFTIVAGVAQMV